MYYFQETMKVWIWQRKSESGFGTGLLIVRWCVWLSWLSELPEGFQWNCHVRVDKLQATLVDCQAVMCLASLLRLRHWHVHCSKIVRITSLLGISYWRHAIMALFVAHASILVYSFLANSELKKNKIRKCHSERKNFIWSEAKHFVIVHTFGMHWLLVVNTVDSPKVSLCKVYFCSTLQTWENTVRKVLSCVCYLSDC